MNRCETTDATPNFLSAQELRQWSTLNDARTWSGVVGDMTIIGAAIAVYELWTPGYFYPLLVMIIGARQHGLLILMHDAVHRRLLANRRSNELLGYVLGWLCLLRFENYRCMHLAHHRHLNTDRDPDWVSQQQAPHYVHPESWSDFAWIFVKTITGMELVTQLRRILRYSGARHQSGPSHPPYRLFGYVGVAFITTMVGWWNELVLYWLVPLLTWLTWIVYVRGMAEHQRLEPRTGNRATRTVRTSWLAAFFLSPHNIGYHMEHHLYPSVPWHRLQALHYRLLQETEYQNFCHIKPSYLSVLQECIQVRTKICRAA